MKVSLYFDDELWNRFKKKLLQRTGDPRILSKQVQALVQESLVEDALRVGFDRIGVEFRTMTAGQVDAVRPSVQTSSAKTLREMRKVRLGKAVS